MVKTYTVALAATAILISVTPSLAYGHEYQYEARDLVDYSEHMARDVSDFYLEAREPEMDFESLYARADKKDEEKDKHKPSFFRKHGRKSRKSKLVALKKTCAKLEGKEKDDCTKEYKEINQKATEALKKYRDALKKAKGDKKKQKEDEKKKKKDDEKKKKEEEKKKKEEEKKKKEEEEKKKKEEEKKKSNKRELDDVLEAREAGYETYLSLLQRAYDEDLAAREFFDINDLD